MNSSNFIPHTAPLLPSYLQFNLHEFPPSFQHNLTTINKLLSWHPVSWYQNLPKNLEESLPVCKIQEAPELHYKNYQILTPQIQQFVKNEELSYQKSQQIIDIFASWQRKALQLIRQKRLSFDQIDILKRYRAMRIDYYRFKKSRRNFTKKIVYDTRKKVADQRIRYRGKFINESQAKKFLGVQDESHSFQQLKRKMKGYYDLL